MNEPNESNDAMVGAALMVGALSGLIIGVLLALILVAAL